MTRFLVKNLRFPLFTLMLLLLLAGTSSCKITESEPDSPVEPVIPPDTDPALVKRAILVYAVNRSTLSVDFHDDSSEMLCAMPNIDREKYHLLLFRTNSTEDCGLYYAAPTSSGEYDFRLIKKYDRKVPSTHPDVISTVIHDALEIYPNAVYDLVIWGHGMSWYPFFTDHTLMQSPAKAYGGELNSSSSSSIDWTEIDELADAVPDHRFETIWFDCCYMSGIENIYQFRNKCSTFVAYPTEVWSMGSPYTATLPLLFREEPDVVGAAREFYASYSVIDEPATIAVIDMSALEPVADLVKEIISSGDLRPSVSGLLNYSRTKSMPMYDLGQYFRETAALNDRQDLAEAFNAKLGELVLFHAESDRDFSLRYWDTSCISGVNVHHITGRTNDIENYYTTLDWYKRVYL